MVLKIYIDGVSQPARALMFFVRAANIPHEENSISVLKGEQKTEEYRKVNKFQKVPAIVHDDFHLAESVAIFRYLARTFKVADHWYPQDSRRMARVDEYMSWQHLGLRSPVTRFVLMHLNPSRITSVPPTPEVMAEHKTAVDAALDAFENIWLKDSSFVNGEQISVADLLAVGELEMLKLVGVDPRDGRATLTAYLDRCRDALAPHWDDVHASLNGTIEYFKSLKKQ